MNPADVITRPIVTEKSTALSELGKYVFQVRSGTSKQAIRSAVEAMFHVEVLSVNVMNLVTLREGHSIEVVPGV